MHTLIEQIPVNVWESLLSIKIFLANSCPHYSEYDEYLYILESDFQLDTHQAGNHDIWFKWPSVDLKLKALSAFNIGSNICY